MTDRLSKFYTDNSNRIVSINHQEIKKEVIGFYSKGTYACNCCKENNIIFLTIDHINNNGKEHRKTFNGGIHEWLKSHGFPDGYQVLCFNCNIGKYLNDGVCPHKINENTTKLLTEREYKLYTPPDWFLKINSFPQSISKNMIDIDKFIEREFVKRICPNGKVLIYKYKNVVEYTDNIVVTNPKGQNYVVEISGFKDGNANILKIEELLKIKKIKFFVLDNKLIIHIKNKELYENLKEFILKNAG